MNKNLTQPTTTILIVDDEEGIVRIIENHLIQEGYHTFRALNGQEAFNIAAEQKIDLILLDWMMPGLNGLDTFRRIQDIAEIPVIFLTAKSEEVDKLLGLELGADDYITKPFSLRELVVRIRVVLRRWSKTNTVFQQEKEDGKIIRGGLSIDVSKYSVHSNGVEIALTPTEFKILQTLAAKPGRVYSRLQLLELALGLEYEGYERSIDTHILNLRKKIEPDPSDPQYIITVFGVGYKFGEWQ